MNGKIYIVGTGPGAKEHMSMRAVEALKESDVVVGYKTYIDLISGLIDGKEVISSGMRREAERCSQAIGLAVEGKSVSLISSGDPGVYGMAGILLEMLHQSPHQVPVEIVPGITSALSSASLAGAPLMNDFVVISLSDLMTPWQVIENRVDKAAQGDFVICIYNPKSAGRVKHIETCMEIIGRYRTPDTPVAVIHDAMREGAGVTLTTLAEATSHRIDMTTTVIVGNSQTFVSRGKMITPRGYTI